MAKKQFKIKLHGGTEQGLIASIEGITDRNQAELLRGIELYARAEARPDKKENSWYHGELVGLKAQLENGKSYGKVIAMHNFGAGDIIEIELAIGKTEMLPFKDSFVGKVNTQGGYMIVHPPEYLEVKEKP